MEHSIEVVKAGFTDTFSDIELYNRQTNDSKHLNMIINSLPVGKTGTILDIGTRTGYLATDGIKNLEYMSYNGLDIPFGDKSIDVIVSRYAFHHFADPLAMLIEVKRVLKRGGILYISDFTVNDDDSTGFIDEYMRVKREGHNKLYSKSEYMSMTQRAGFALESCEVSYITYSQKNQREYEEIISRHSKEIVSGYDVRIEDEDIYITERVLNMCFSSKL